MTEQEANTKLQLRRTILTDNEELYIVKYQLLHNDETIYEDTVKSVKQDIFGKAVSIADVDAFAIKHIQTQIEVV